MNKIKTQYMIKKLDILYPLNKLVIKHLFCLNDLVYFYIVMKERKEYIYILEDSKMTNLELDYLQNNSYFLKKNIFNFKKIRLLHDKNKQVLLQINDKKMYFIECNDLYMYNMFNHIYKIVY